MNKQLTEILADVFGLRANQIVPELTKNAVGSWDSLKQLDLVTTLEKTYTISLEIHDIVSMTSVASIVDVLRSKGVDLGD